MSLKLLYIKINQIIKSDELMGPWIIFRKYFRNSMTMAFLKIALLIIEVVPIEQKEVILPDISGSTQQNSSLKLICQKIFT